MSAILHGSEKALALKEKFMHEVSCPLLSGRLQLMRRLLDILLSNCPISTI